jgi:hypothetical protein
MINRKAILIGFFPQKTKQVNLEVNGSYITEICSASEHISKGPDNWISNWKHNDPWMLYDSEAVAREVTGADYEAYDIYAYKLFPVIFEGTAETIIIIKSTISNELTDFAFLGYDIVSSTTGSGFECSPLSCNNGYEKYTVNKYCLISEINYAWETIKEIARDSKEKKSWEPGPYYLVEVYRQIKIKS